MSTRSKFSSTQRSGRKEYGTPGAAPELPGLSPQPWCQQTVSQRDAPARHWTDCFSCLYLLWPGQLQTDLPSSQCRTLFQWWRPTSPQDWWRATELAGASTVTCCTRLLNESHWQTSFAGISRKSRELDASSSTGHSAPEFFGKTPSILMEDIVMGEILVLVTFGELAPR